jgi:hypothetical protein
LRYLRSQSASISSRSSRLVSLQRKPSIHHKKKKKETRSARRKLDNECIIVETEKTGRRSRDATLPAAEGWAHETISIFLEGKIDRYDL